MLKSMMLKCVAIAVTCSISSIAVAMANPKQLDIPAGGLVTALETLSKQAAIEIVYQPDQLRSFRTKGVAGTYEPADAVRILLKGTPCELRMDASGAMAITLPPRSPVQDHGRKEGKASSSATFRLAQTPAESGSNAAPVAQEPGVEKAGVLGEIIVTAQKRPEKLLDVPASISALTFRDIAAQHIETIDDVTRAVPGISFNAQSGNGTTVGVGSESIVIRGIGSAVGSATVGLYLDGIPLTQLIQAGSFVPKPFDLDRVEVLRGPQGTLYGASSEGGTVRFITTQPELNEFAGYVTGNLSHTQHGRYNTDDEAVVNLPVVTNVLAVRAGVEITENSGWINRYANAPGTLFTPTNIIRKDVNSERDLVSRIVAKYQPDPTLTITPAVWYQREYQDDSPSYYLNEAQFQQSKSVAEWGRDSGLIPSLTIDKSFEFGDLTSVSGYFLRHFDRAKDGTFFDSNYVVPSFLDTDPRTAAEQPIADLTLAVLPVTVIDWDRVTVFNQEIRLASPAARSGIQKVNWVVGAYFSDDVDHTKHDELAPGWNSLFQQIYGFDVNNPELSPLADPGNPLAWQDNFLYFLSRYEARQIAAFGQVDYKILPRLRASAGLRYQVSNLTMSYNATGYYDIGISNINGDRARDSAVTPKFALTYELNPTANVYASAAKGYRDGGFNVPPVPQSLCAADEPLIGLRGSAPSSYAPDRLWSYELGFKALLADRRLSVDADVYDIRWSGIQQQITIPVCAFDFTANVGAAEAYGTEIEVKYIPPLVTGLTLGVSASKEHATITETSPNSGAAVGDELLFTPDFTATASATYTRPIGQNRSVFLQANEAWQGRSNGEFTPGLTDSINRQYEELNASLGIRSGGGLEVQIYSKNLLNSATVLREPTVAAVTEAYTLPPRIIGIQATEDF